MRHTRPLDVRSGLTSLLEAITPTTAYAKTGDAWTASQEPFAADMVPEDVPLSHLLFFVDIRQVEEWAEGGEWANGSLAVKIPVTVWFLYKLASIGDHARVTSMDGVLEAARHVLRHVLRNGEAALGDVTFVTGPGILYRANPLPIADAALGEVHFSVLCAESLEV
jgi:hypothetical protein